MVVAGEDLGHSVYQRLGLVPVPGVVLHLPAARLAEREVHLDPKPLQQGHHRLAGAREERVVDAGDEEGYAHGFLLRRA